ncbi:hypothetical protein LINPERHAP1_LOCUS27599, partial [Linum perenne]
AAPLNAALPHRPHAPRRLPTTATTGGILCRANFSIFADVKMRSSPFPMVDSPPEGSPLRLLLFWLILILMFYLMIRPIVEWIMVPHSRGIPATDVENPAPLSSSEFNL